MESDLERAKIIVLKFTNQMNDWEEKAYIFHRIKHQQLVSEEKRKLVEGQTEESLNSLYYRILNEFCTQKKRTYGGHPYSYGNPTRYAGINNEKILEVNQVKKNRIEVIAESEAFSKTFYLFVILKTKGEWRIDSLKWKAIQDWQNFLL